MPLKLDVQRVLSGRSERVKSVDIHPSNPWILSALYSGHVWIWNYESESVVRTFEVSEVPVRCAKFIARRHWIVCGCDDMHIRVYNYNTCEKVKEYEAHTDYLRTIAVHPTLPFVLSGSDDMSIKLWDWENNWENTMIFEGHTHYVMQIEMNPKDSNSFASAGLDRSIKVWGLNSSVPHFQLEGHEKGVNCVAYYHGGERPFLVSGADDKTVKVWDYQTKTCVATLEGHTQNISAVMFHPQLPIIISGSEDGAIKIWHSNTYRLETTLQYQWERVWSIAGTPASNKVAIGFDDGTIVIKCGQEEPVVSMDGNGKVIWARNHEIQLINVMRLGKVKSTIADGEILPVAPDDLGSCEFYPNSVKHNKNGQLVAVCGDGEYTIYTALRLKNKSFGNAIDFVWSDRSNVYATRESSTKIKIFKQFKEHKTIRTSFDAKQIFGGHLLGIRSNEFIDFYTWDDARIVRRIEVCPKSVQWSDSGSMVSVICDDNFYLLRYNEEIVDKYISREIETDEQGIQQAFDLEQDISDVVMSGVFNGEIFVYTNDHCRLNYYVGGFQSTLAHLDRVFYVLGYLHKDNRVYLIDKRYNLVSYELLRYVLAYQAAIVRGDLETASTLLKRKKIPESHFNKLAHFLESQGYAEKALEVSKDPEHQFELALKLKKLNLAKKILMESPTKQKWRQLGDLAMTEGDFITLEECAIKGDDLNTLFLLYTSMNDGDKLYELSQLAIEKRKFNIGFNCLYLLGLIDECIEMLLKNDRIPQAAFFARSYAPRHVERIHRIWRESLKKISPMAAKALGNAESHPDHFALKESGESETNEMIGSSSPAASAAAASKSPRQSESVKSEDDPDDDVKTSQTNEMSGGIGSGSADSVSEPSSQPSSTRSSVRSSNRSSPRKKKSPRKSESPRKDSAAAIKPAKPVVSKAAASPAIPSVDKFSSDEGESQDKRNSDGDDAGIEEEDGSEIVFDDDDGEDDENEDDDGDSLSVDLDVDDVI